MSEKKEEDCPYCNGEMILQKDLRDGYEDYKDDPDAYAYYFRCRSCASQSGWSKSETGARRLLQMRLRAEHAALKDEWIR